MTLIILDISAFLLASSTARRARTTLRSMVEEARLIGLIQPQSRVSWKIPKPWAIYFVGIPLTIFGLLYHPMDYYVEIRPVELAWFVFPVCIVIGYFLSWRSPTYKIAIFNPDRIDAIINKEDDKPEHITMRWKDTTVNVSMGEGVSVSLTDGKTTLYHTDYLNSDLVWYFLLKNAPEKIPVEERVRKIVREATKRSEKRSQVWP